MIVWSACRYVDHSGFIDGQFQDPDFATFVEKFLDPAEFIPVDKKDELPLFIPAEFVAGEVVRRSSHNVLAVTLGVLDLDHGTTAEQEHVLSIVRKYGHAVYSSFSHNPAGQHKHRAIVKLSRPVQLTEWRAFFPRMLDHFHALKVADEKCKDACHMYFVPGGNPSHYSQYGEDGDALDVDLVLAAPAPEGAEDVEPEAFDDILPEEERDEIGQGLKELWLARLAHLVRDIETRPYPGPIYDLVSHGVFGVARGCDHILSSKKLKSAVMAALDYRYKRARGEDAFSVPVYRVRAEEHVDIAIEEGLQRPWWPKKSLQVIARPLTEFGLAERLVDQHQKDIRWEPQWQAWVGWNGKHWDNNAGTEVVKLKVFDTIRNIPKEAHALGEDYMVAKELYQSTLSDPNVSTNVKLDAEFKYEQLKKQVEALYAFAMKCETSAKQGSTANIACAFPEVITTASAFNRNPWLVNFTNGTLDLSTGDFREHRREDFVTRMVPYPFIKDAECVLFDKFMREFMCDNERMVNFLWRAIGYTACGVTDEQKIFLLHGDGANAKSTLLNLLMEIFGQGPTGYAMAANSENLLSTKGSSKHETWRMSLAGVRLVCCQEVDEGRSFAESLIKELTGSDMITGRKMYQNEWSYKPEFTLWLAINHLPHVRGTDEGIWRRLCVIECKASFKDKPDRDLPRRLLAEAPGIWARIAREAKLWTKERLVLPREVIVANTLYRQEQDPLKDFVERWCVVDAEAVEPRPTVWAAYEEYCTENKTRVFHERKRFYAALEKQFAAKKLHGERFFAGLRIKTPKERLESSPRAILQRANKAREEEQPN
jgi:putative DNA primase/helicase